MSNADDLGDESVILIEDHVGNGFALELDTLPHVEAALKGVQSDGSRLNELAVEIARRVS